MTGTEKALHIAAVFLFAFLVAFAAYVAGRRQYSLASLHWLLLVEALAIGLSVAAMGLFAEARE